MIDRIKLLLSGWLKITIPCRQSTHVYHHGEYISKYELMCKYFKDDSIDKTN